MHVIDTKTTCDLSRIIVHTDGACSGNPAPGGWAAIIIGWNGDGKAFRYDIWGGDEDPTTTNQQMELTAAIEALVWIKDQKGFATTTPILIRSDSQYLVNGMNIWLANWLSNGWKASDKGPVKNRSHWASLDFLTEGMDITWEWVRGHSGDPLNEAADALAKAAIPKKSRRRAA